LNRWRLLREDGVTARHGLAVDDSLTAHVTRADRPTLRLYTYRPHAALIGRFQDLDHEVHVAYCASEGLDVNRRPTGGGAILMGPDQLGVALIVPGRGAALRPRALMQRFSEGLRRSLATYGIDAEFRGKNDLEVGGRKIAGLGIHRDPGGGLLFHASLLVDLDVALMARVLKTPFTAVTEAEIETVSSRTTTVRANASRDLSVHEVRARVAEGFTHSFGVRLEPGELTPDEVAAAAALDREKYGAESWLRQQPEVHDSAGKASLPTANGRLEVHAAVVGAMIKALHLRGAFFETEAAIADLEARLRWHAASAEAVRATVFGWASARPETGLDPEDVTRAITAAIDAARDQAPDPYGCFVTPEVSRG